PPTLHRRPCDADPPGDLPQTQGLPCSSWDRALAARLDPHAATRDRHSASFQEPNGENRLNRNKAIFGRRVSELRRTGHPQHAPRRACEDASNHETDEQTGHAAAARHAPWLRVVRSLLASADPPAVLVVGWTSTPPSRSPPRRR